MNRHGFCCNICGDGVEIQKKNKRNEFTLFRGTGNVCFFSFTKVSLIMMVLMVAVVSVLGDDTQALQDTLSSLCSLNKEGQFGSCCEKYDISSVTLASSEARACFVTSLTSATRSVITLFVFLLHRGIYSFSEVLKTRD